MFSLVVEYDIRQPDDLRGDVDFAHPPVLGRVPYQLVVPPLLHPPVTLFLTVFILTVSTHRFVVKIWFFRSWASNE